MIYKTFAGMPHQPLSAIGFGCWALGGGWSSNNEAQMIDAIRKAIEKGINFFDTAPIYGKGSSEELLGRALKLHQRDKLIVATKCGILWNARGRVRQDITPSSLRIQLEQSLIRLQTDYIDLYQIHWPYAAMPLEGALAELLLMQKEGLIRFIGLSNFSRDDFLLAQSLAPIATYQGLYNLLEPNASHYHRAALPYRSSTDILPLCRQSSIPFIAYSPLMQGMLTGKFGNGVNFSQQDERMSNDNLRGEGLLKNMAIIDQLTAYGHSIGQTLHQLAIIYIARQEIMGPVLCGMHRPSHIDKNIEALEVKLTDREARELALIAQPV